jgi:leucine dehydrogenase
LQFIPVEELYQTGCDVFAPCALGGVLDETTIPQLKCRVVAGGANNQLAQPEDAERLRARGIIYAPDYVVNVGGAMAIPGIETQGWSQAEAEEKVVKSVRYALQRIIQMAEEQGITTEEAAHRIAEEHLSKQF